MMLSGTSEKSMTASVEDMKAAFREETEDEALFDRKMMMAARFRKYGEDNNKPHWCEVADQLESDAAGILQRL